MLPSLKNLEVINFGDCLVKTEGAKALAKCLQGAVNNLKNLNLSFDEISKEGALAIVEALASKESLEKLELNGRFVGYEIEFCAEIHFVVIILLNETRNIQISYFLCGLWRGSDSTYTQRSYKIF